MPQATANKRLLPIIKAAVLTAWLRLRANIVVIAQQKAAAIASVAGQTSGVVDRPAAMSTPPKPTRVASQRHGPTISPSTGLDIATTNKRRGEIERHEFGQLQRARRAIIGEPRRQDEQSAQCDRREIAPLHHAAKVGAANHKARQCDDHHASREQDFGDGKFHDQQFDDGVLGAERGPAAGCQSDARQRAGRFGLCGRHGSLERSGGNGERRIPVRFYDRGAK